LAFFRNPIGTFVRHAPDLFQGNVGWGSVTGIQSGTVFEDGGILNQDKQGRVMLVWAYVINLALPNKTSFPTCSCDVGIISGDEGALGPSLITPMNPLAGALQASVWDTPTGSGLSGNSILFTALHGEGHAESFSAYPIAAVPVGYSIVAAISGVVGGASLGFSWAFMVEFVGPQP